MGSFKHEYLSSIFIFVSLFGTILNKISVQEWALLLIYEGVSKCIIIFLQSPLEESVPRNSDLGLCFCYV